MNYFVSNYFNSQGDKLTDILFPTFVGIDPSVPRPAVPLSKVADDDPVKSPQPFPRGRDGLLQQPELRFAGQPRDAVALHRDRGAPRRQIEGSRHLYSKGCPSS